MGAEITTKEPERRIAQHADPRNESIQQLPTINIHSEDSVVKIGDEFNFAKDVIIVAPDECKGKTEFGPERHQRTLNNNEHSGETKPPKRGLLHARLGCPGLHSHISPTHKALTAIIAILLIGLLITALYQLKPADPVEISSYVERNKWNAGERTCVLYDLKKPTPLVIIQHTTGTFCKNFQECKTSVRNTQTLYQQSHCDIKYGFVVGGDCRVYEGRNFKQKHDMNNDPFFNSSVEVAFVGDYSRDIPDACQIKVLVDFLMGAVSNGFLDRQFKIVGAMQVYRSQPHSPGLNLMNEIKKLPMWTNETYF